MAIRERSVHLPSIVFESGWSERIKDLRRDMSDWFIGGNGIVEVVILINWTKLANRRVRGEVEAWVQDRNGFGQLAETHVSS